MQCNICGVDNIPLEDHHIIPISRGGTDDPQNKILVCIDCHGKAHDVTFRGERGLVSKALQNRQGKTKTASNYFKTETGIIKYNTFMADIFCTDRRMYDFIMSGFELGFITPLALYEVIEEGKPLKCRKSIKIM